MVPIKSLVTVSYFNTRHECESHPATETPVYSFWFTNVCMAWHHHTSQTNFVHQQSEASAFRFVSRTVCSPYPTLNLWRPIFSSRRCTDLEQSSAAYHICSVTSCLLLSLEDILLRTVPRNDCCRAREVTLSFIDTLIALTYLLQDSYAAAARYEGTQDNVITSFNDETLRLSVVSSTQLHLITVLNITNVHKHNVRRHSTRMLRRVCQTSRGRRLLQRHRTLLTSNVSRQKTAATSQNSTDIKRLEAEDCCNVTELY